MKHAAPRHATPTTPMRALPATDQPPSTGDPAAPELEPVPVPEPESESESEQPGRHLAPRRKPRTALWLTASYGVLLFAYSLMVPLFRGPDEMWHIDLAHHFSEDLDYPAWDERVLDPGIREATAPLAGLPLDAEEARPRDRRPTFDELARTERARERAPARNHMAQHPPLYYGLLGAADRLVDVVVPGDPFGSYDAQVWFYRLVSALMIAPLPLLIHRAGRVVGAPPLVALTAAAFPLAIPQLFHIGSVVNNDNLLILLSALLMLPTIRLARGDLTARTAAVAGALTGLALFTKGTAMVLPIVVGIALLVALLRRGATWLQTLRTGALYGAVTLLFGGWWWVRNLLAEGKLQPSLEYDRFSESTGAPTGVARFVHGWAYYTNRRFWGEFGYFEVHLPSVALIAATVVTALGLVWALGRPSRPRGVGFDLRLVLLAPLLLFATAVAAQAYRFYAQSGQRPLLQGRYWYPGLVGLVLLVALGLSAILGRRARYLSVGILVGAAAMQVTGAGVVLGHYWGTARSDLGEQLAAVRDWAPIPTPGLITILVIGAIVLVATAASVTRQCVVSPVRDATGDA